MEYFKLYYQTILEAPNFPGWEIYIALNLMLWVSVILRLNRIENNQTKKIRKK